MMTFQMQLCRVILGHIALVNIVLGLRVWPYEAEPYSCADGLHRISAELRCDGTHDCKDGSDEVGCNDFKDRPSYTHLEFKMLERNSSRLDKKLYSWFWETYKPIPVENAPTPGDSVHSVELWKLTAPHSNAMLALQGWKHEGIGFLLKDAEGLELGRVAYQYWSASKTAPSERLPPILLDANGNLTYDEKGRLGFNSRAVVTYSRSRDNWEGGYWKDNTLLTSLSKEKYKDVASYIEQWHEANQQFIPFGFIYDLKSWADISHHPKFMHRMWIPDANRLNVCFRAMTKHGWQEVGTVLQHPHGCLGFNIDVVQMAAGIDLSTEHGATFSHFRAVKPVELFASASRAQELMQQGKLAMKWGQDDDSDGLIVVPAWFDADGKPLEQGDFVEKVHIVKPRRIEINGNDDAGAASMPVCKVWGVDGDCPELTELSKVLWKQFHPEQH